MFLFFRGISKLITYIILLLHETNQRPLSVLGRQYTQITHKFRQCLCQCTALFAYITVTGFRMVIFDWKKEVKLLPPPPPPLPAPPLRLTCV